MFHVADGLYFERIEADAIDGGVVGTNPRQFPSRDEYLKMFGGVRIIKRESGKPDAPIVFEQALDADSWASVVSSMTILGETGALWRAIVALQRGQ
jgi:hypothetical protein